MAYNFLGLVNDVCQRFNEVELTSSNFSSSTGFYSSVKQYINSSLDDLNQTHYMWPWNYVSYDETLVAGQTRYDYQSDVKIMDFDTVRIQRNDTFGNETVRLTPINYDEYLRKMIDLEYNTDTSVRDLPRFIFKDQNRGYGVTPPPDNAYTLTYEYFKRPAQLSASTDVPLFPEDFRSVIVDGASAYAYRFRGDIETSDRLETRFLDRMDELRRVYIPMEDDLVSTMRAQKTGYLKTTLEG